METQGLRRQALLQTSWVEHKNKTAGGASEAGEASRVWGLGLVAESNYTQRIERGDCAVISSHSTLITCHSSLVIDRLLHSIVLSSWPWSVVTAVLVNLWNLFLDTLTIRHWNLDPIIHKRFSQQSVLIGSFTNMP